MKKRIVAALMSLAIASAAVVGCGAGESTGSAAPEAEAVQEAAGEDAEETAEAAETAAAAEDVDFSDGGDPLELKLVMVQSGTREGWDEIEEKINEITSEEIGVVVDVDWIEIGNWNQQIGLRMSSGEQMDLIHMAPFMSFASLMSTNQLLDITAELEEYGQDILRIDAPYMDSVKVGGSYYGVPNYFPKGASIFLEMRTDTLEELGLTEAAANIKTWDDYAKILEAVRDNTDYRPLQTKGMTGYGTTYAGRGDFRSENFAEATSIEGLGDPYGLIHIDPETNKVYSYYQSDIFKKDCERAADYYSRDLLYKDGATDQESTLMSSNLYFSFFNCTETLFAEETIEAESDGLDITFIEMTPVPLDRSTANLWGFGVPYTCAYPEAAVAFLNLMFTNEELANLFTWGIEGRDYTVNENGSAQRTENTQYFNIAFFMPNAVIPHSSRVNVDNYQAIAEQAIADQEYSKFMAFDCDIDPINNELTACYNAKMQYMPALICGSNSDWEAQFDEFQKKLDENGMQEILAYYQEQVDAFLAAQ